jgi:hypothetical protein
MVKQEISEPQQRIDTRRETRLIYRWQDAASIRPHPAFLRPLLLEFFK